MKNKHILGITIFVIFLIILGVLGSIVYRSYANKTRFEEDITSFAEKNKNTIFTLEQAMFFSSAYSNSKVGTNSSFQLENLYQYTDIALFIKPSTDEIQNPLETTLKQASITDISISSPPEVGTPKLYYKSMEQFAKPQFLDKNELGSSLTFNITSDNKADLSTPTLYNNCANPITFTYINYNIKKDYTVDDAKSKLTYDGSLLKKCNVILSSLSCNISFTIHLVNHLDQEFECPINITIPLENENSSIYDGNYIEKKNINTAFYRTK